MKRVTITLAALLATIFALALTIWLKPELVVKPKVVRWALNTFAPEQNIRFSKLTFSSRNLSFLSKKVDLELRDLCISSKSPTLAINGCLSSATVGLSFQVGRKGFDILSIKTVKLTASETISITQTPSEVLDTNDSSDTTVIGEYQSYFKLIERLLVAPKPIVEILLSRVEFSTGELKLLGSTKIINTGNDKIKLTMALSGMPKVESNAEITGQWGPKKLVKLESKATKIKIAKLNVSIENRNDHPETFWIQISASDSAWKMFKKNQLQASLKLSHSRAELASKSNLRFIPGTSMIHVFNKGCGVVAEVLAKDRFDVNLDCPIKVQYPFTYGHVDFNLKNTIKISGDARNLHRGTFSHLTEHQDKFTKLHIHAETAYDFSEGGTDLTKYFLNKMIPSLALNLELYKIRDWLSTIPEKYTMLPAPLNSMNGTIKLTVDKSDDLKKSAKLSLNIKDKTQRINFDLLAKANFDVPGHTPALDIDFTLKNLALRLPRWNFSDPKPRLFADSRFISGKPVASPVKNKRAPLKLKTDALNPIRISSNLIKEQLRILFDVDWKDGVITRLDVKLLPLKAEFLRRKFEIESVHFRTNAGKSSNLIDATVRFFLPDYTINANVEGTTEQPVITLTSNPPLAENDIYSVLVFGKPMSALQAEQQNSLAAARQSFATGLFSLTSLYFLGSTPIESIYFDPNTGEATARVRLDSKSSISVGADTSDVNRVELRRSLGKGWYIQGGVSDLDQNNENYGGSVEKVISY